VPDATILNASPRIASGTAMESTRIVGRSSSDWRRASAAPMNGMYSGTAMMSSLRLSTTAPSTERERRISISAFTGERSSSIVDTSRLPSPEAFSSTCSSASAS
jgi:hypothetical protein